MKSNIKILIFALGLSFVVVAGSVIGYNFMIQNTPKDIWEPQEEFIDLDGNVTIGIYERFTKEKDGGHLILSITTQTIYPCCNYRLNVKITLIDNMILAEIINITAPSIGLTALGPASFSYDLGKINGTYTLVIRHKDEENRYTLEITEEAYTITEEDISFTQPQNNGNFRFPIGSILVGSIKGAKDTNHTDLTPQFLNDLEKIGAIKSEKEYGRNLSDNYFLYDYNGDFHALKTLIEHYAQFNHMFISIRTWKGDEFMSWIIPDITQYYPLDEKQGELDSM